MGFGKQAAPVRCAVWISGLTRPRPVLLIGCGGEIRTHDLQLMRLASYLTALLHVIVTRCVQRLHRMQHDGGATSVASQWG